MGLGRPDRPGTPRGILHAPARLVLLAAGALRRGPALALALALGLGLAGGADRASAQDLPATFRVVGVASRDVLNVRARPSTDAAVLDTLAPTATGVEVLAFSPDGAWAKVPLAEGPGWVARRFLATQPVTGDGLPRPLACHGTEPFWSLSLTADAASLELAGRPARALRPAGEVAGRQGWMASFEGAQGGGPSAAQTGDLAVVRKACSDGMSDRPYGLAAMIWARGGNGGDRLLEGCCTLQP